VAEATSAFESLGSRNCTVPVGAGLVVPAPRPVTMEVRLYVPGTVPSVQEDVVMLGYGAGLVTVSVCVADSLDV